MSSRHASRALVALALALALPIPAEPRDRDLVRRERPVTADAFRSDFLRLVDVLEEIAVLTQDADRHQRLEDARRIVAAMPPDQLAEFLSHGALDLGPVIRANVKLRTMLAERVASREPGAEPQSTIPDRPPILNACDVLPHDSAFTFGALIAVQVADAALAAVGRVCDQVVVAAGFGSNTALVCLPLEIALGVAKAPFELADFCGGEEDSSFLEGSYERLGVIHGDLEASVANDDNNRDIIIANDDANSAAIRG
jgi:hypothetical protein